MGCQKSKIKRLKTWNYLRGGIQVVGQGREDYIEFFDESHSEDEDRFIAIGSIAKGVIVVVYIEKSFDLIRIISARRATKNETSLFIRFKGVISK
jgi:uncharacterized DUF497 family protein